jgi:hypothetical protein
VLLVVLDIGFVLLVCIAAAEAVVTTDAVIAFQENFDVKATPTLWGTGRESRAEFASEGLLPIRPPVRL